MGMMIFAIGEILLWFVNQYALRFFDTSTAFFYVAWQIILIVGYLSWVFEKSKK